MTKTGSPRLYKSVFVASFRPNLRYFSLFRTAAERVSGFANWSTDDSSVSLRDYQARCSLAIRHNEFAFSQDSADLRNEEQRIHSALEVLPAALEVNTFSRLGFRRQYLIAIDMQFESLVEILGLKLLGRDKELAKILPGRMEDMLYRVNQIEGENRFNIWVGPLRKREVPQWIQFDPEHFDPAVRGDELRQVFSAFPDVSMLIDLDMYRRGSITVAEGRNFVADARRRIDDLARMFHNYVLAQELK